MSKSSAYQVRAIRPEDQEGVRALVERRPFPHSDFQDPHTTRVNATKAVEKYFHLLQSEEKLAGLVAVEGDQVVGYAVAQTGQEESITKEPQSLVYDYYAPGPEMFASLMRGLAEQARAAGDLYLVFYLFHDQREQEPWARAVGFSPELIRVTRVVTPEHQWARHPDYGIRRAQELELLYIMKLVAKHSPLYRPANRTVDQAKIQQAFVNAYSNLSVDSKKRVPLVIVDKDKLEPMGYLIVEPGRVGGPGTPLTLYIYDIAVDKEARGKGLARYLCGGGERLLAQMGGGVFYGDISADNEPTVKTQEALGFRIDSTRWGLKVADI